MKELAATDASISTYDQSIGNWGLMDQKLAFEWVRENITAFGGNHRDVTAWGESAGSISIHYHMLFPTHRGLFDRAIMQSGTVATISPGLPHKDGQALFDSLLQQLDIPLDLDGKEKMRRLREIPAEKLAIVGFHVVQGPCKPYYDGGKVIPSKVPIQVLAQDLSAYDPSVQSILIGTTKDEGSQYATVFGDTSLKNWPNLVKILSPTPQLASLFESVYGTPQTDEEAFFIGSRYVGDSFFFHPTQVLLEKLRELTQTRKGFKVAQFRFDVAMQRLAEFSPRLGAMHASELPFVFNPEDTKAVMTEKEVTVSKEMQLIWIGFANQDTDIFKAKSIQFTIPDQVNGTTGHWNGLYLSKEASEFWSAVAKLQQDALMADF